MKNLKIWSLLMLLAATVSSCNNGEGGGKPAAGLEHIVNEWKLATWGGADAPFTVYIDFNEDGSYELFQQIYDLSFVKFSGKYNISGDIITGTYADGSNWKSGYKVGISGDGSTLTMYSQEDVSIEGVYQTTIIPEDVKAEGNGTRVAADVEPML